jgi:hypothetical protein
MEACVGAHHLSRKLQVLWSQARLMPAKYVRPYSKGRKNDFRDAQWRSPRLFVATKITVGASSRPWALGQPAHQSDRRFLLERGVTVRQGLRFLRTELPERCRVSLFQVPIEVWCTPFDRIPLRHSAPAALRNRDHPFIRGVVSVFSVCAGRNFFAWFRLFRSLMAWATRCRDHWSRSTSCPRAG